VGDRPAFLHLEATHFEKFCTEVRASQAPMCRTGSLDTQLFAHISNLLFGYSVLSRSNFKRTVVRSIDEADKRVVVIAKEGAVGHAQLFALAEFHVVAGVSIRDKHATAHDTTGDGTQREQAEKLAAFINVIKRTTGFKSSKPVHTALLDPAAVRAACSFAATTALGTMDTCTDPHTSLMCPACGDVVLLSALCTRNRRSRSLGTPHRTVPLCSKCRGVPAFKDGSYVPTAHLPTVLNTGGRN
jgi:hypothetical protein